MDPYSAYAHSPQSNSKEKKKKLKQFQFQSERKQEYTGSSQSSLNRSENMKSCENHHHHQQQQPQPQSSLPPPQQQQQQHQQKYQQYREDRSFGRSSSNSSSSSYQLSLLQHSNIPTGQDGKSNRQQHFPQHSSGSMDRSGITDIQTGTGNQMNIQKKGDRGNLNYTDSNNVNTTNKSQSHNNNNDNIANTNNTSYSFPPTVNSNSNNYIYRDYNPYTYPNIGFFGERYKDKDGHIITDPNTIEEGYLRKRGIRISSLFSERYFVLKDDKIFYYQKENDLLAKGAYVLNKSCLVSQVKVHTQNHSYHKNKKLYIFSVSWPMAIETTEEYVPGTGTSQMVLEDGTRSTSMLSTTILGYNKADGDKDSSDKQYPQHREKRSSTFLSNRSNRRTSDLGQEKGSIDSITGLDSSSGKRIGNNNLGENVSHDTSNGSDQTWGNTQSTATIKVIQSYFMNMGTSGSTNTPVPEVEHKPQGMISNQTSPYPNSDPTNPNAPKSTTKQDKTDYTAAKVAALAVGGVVVGTLTAGVIPLAGLMIVGFSAAAGGGGAAFLSSTSKDNKPKPITLTLASESEFTAKAWFSNIEYQIRLLRTVPEGYKGSLLSWTQANGFGIDVGGEGQRDDPTGLAGSNRLIDNESNPSLSMQLLLPIHRNIKEADVPPKATNLKLVSFWTSPALSLWRPVNGSLLGGDGVRIYELVQLQKGIDKSSSLESPANIVNYEDDMSMEIQHRRNHGNDGMKNHVPKNHSNNLAISAVSDGIETVPSKSPRRTRKAKRGRLNPSPLRISNDETNRKSPSNTSSWLSHSDRAKDDSGEDLMNNCLNCRKIQVPVKCSALDAFVAIISNPSKLVSHGSLTHSYNADCQAIPLPIVGCGSIKSIRVIERIDDNADIIHMVLHPMFLWPTWISPRDFCLVRYWRYYKDGTYLVCYNSTVHRGCPQLDDTIRCEMSAAYIISPRKSAGNTKKNMTSLIANLSTSQRYRNLHQYPSIYGYENGGSQIQDGSSECLLTYIVQSDPSGWLWRTGGYIDRFINEILMQALDLRDMLEREVYESIDILSSEGAEQEHVVDTPSARKEPFRATSGARSLSLSSTGSHQRVEGGGFEGYRPHLLSGNSVNKEKHLENGLTSGGLEMIDSSKSLVNFPVSTEESNEDDILAYPTLRNHNPTCPEEMWEDILGDDFNVRGPSYHLDRIKIQSPEAAFECVAVDLFHLDKPINNICAHPNNRIQAATKNGDAPPFTWAIQLQIPGSGAFPHFGYVVYLAPKDPNIFDENRPLTPLTRLLKSFFFEKDDKWRDKRFKLIPRIVDGPWVVRKAVGNTPAILGTKLKQYYYRGPNYFELDVAIESSMAAANIVKLAGSYSKALVVDLAVLIQGDTEDELPEHVVGSWSICKLDLTLAKRI